MVKRIDSLTQEQRDYMPIHAQKWIDIGLKTGETDWVAYEKAVKVAYEKAGHAYPGRLVRTTSPLAAALAAQISSGVIKQQGKPGGAVRDAVDGAVDDAVDVAVRDAVDVAVRGAVGGAVDDAVDGAVDGAVGGAVRGAVDVAVRGAVDVAADVAVDVAVRSAPKESPIVAGTPWNRMYLGNQFWVGYWRGPAFVSFLREVCGLELSADITERADAYQTMCESACLSFLNTNFVIVSERPVQIISDQAGQLHHDQGMAIFWPDGWGLYMLHGVRFDEETYWKIVKEDFSIKDLAELKTAEQRAAAISMLRADRMLEALNAKLVSTGTKYSKQGLVGRQETELYEVKDFMGTGDTEYCLKMKHPSLDQEYIEWTTPDIGRKHDADLAQAEAFGWTKEQYLLAEEA